MRANLMDVRRDTDLESFSHSINGEKERKTRTFPVGFYPYFNPPIHPPTKKSKKDLKRNEKTHT